MSSTLGPTRITGAAVDLSPRAFSTATVAASPTASTETIVATLTLSRDLGFGLGVLLLGYGAYTMGTDGTSCVMRIRRTDASGTIVKASGAIPLAAAALGAQAILGLDTGPTFPNQVYVLTATMAAASAPSTFSAVSLIAVVI